MRRVGIDVGGTFTDVVLIDDELDRHWSVKVPTTPADRVIGAIEGFKAILEISAYKSEDIDFVGHGTTMATNMVVEHKGARTALVTTKGFRDILEIRRVSRHDRADLYDLQFEAPRELVKRRWRLEVDERIDAKGNIAKPLDEEEVKALADQLAGSDIEAVAVCLLHSYTNPAHELRVAEILRERLPDRFITTSHDVNPELMEYERTSTVVMNAMLGPVCSRYIRTFKGALRELGFGGELLFMQSNGGLAHPDFVEARPVVLLESGPAGGVSATTRVTERLGLSNSILGDMGGTTFDVSLIRDSKPELRTSGLLHSYTVRSPTIDIDSVGAGGGSIAWIDVGGGVRIGPESAAADPGPACYGRGGTRPTVTDCNLVLGYIDPDSFLNGTFPLDVEAARRAIEKHLAEPLGTSVLEAARTVRAVANALMAQAMRLMTVERGYDPRDFVYVCYGGAGPVHAIDLASELEIRKVVVPALPGLFSAFGMTVADQSIDRQTSIESELAALDPEALAAMFASLETEVRADLSSYVSGGADIRVTRRVDCRYAGQPEAMTVDIGEGAVDVAGIRAAFEAAHMRQWNFIKPDQPIICVNIRARAEAETGWRGTIRSSDGTSDLEPLQTSRVRRLYLGGEMIDVPVFKRGRLRDGDRVHGPAVIEEASSCLVVDTGHVAYLDAFSNLIVEL
ncbi:MULTISPECIES: hydantoinase/oxoprolinase family protein [Sphingobium]|uniref:hydantoinase/oxoprolinase family protein n=1 Tax=Sphingobium TaxID=165695 RepID=UPI00159C9F79|nr:hydantoinase/oxoprolinase family protein [Sphingobium sp. 15-1]